MEEDKEFAKRLGTEQSYLEKIMDRANEIFDELVLIMAELMDLKKEYDRKRLH